MAQVSQLVVREKLFQDERHLVPNLHEDVSSFREISLELHRRSSQRKKTKTLSSNV